jgi:hypothetical protein
MTWAAISSSIYWLAVFTSHEVRMLNSRSVAVIVSRSIRTRLLPGTAWTDPEFEADTPKPLGLQLQQLLDTALLAVLAAAIALAFLSGPS